eukprot:CAMPEP_0115081858 /NCGR_PEP_ID=MMETSP0227-20121206/19536_1 /TAXON_ID=89957 /ORGANISM="Polarella glacialis, Strain CCMP 1383" /LENGTH=624 /DNA_ID=CAMNT_0002469797 /DNA_START=77 /DNA_END=1947 /DNA_ORIENTATION=+
MWWGAAVPQWQQLAALQSLGGLPSAPSFVTAEGGWHAAAGDVAPGGGATSSATRPQPKARPVIADRRGNVTGGSAAAAAMIAAEAPLAKASMSSKAPKNGLLVRLSSRVQGFEDKLSAAWQAEGAEGGRPLRKRPVSSLRDLVLGSEVTGLDDSDANSVPKSSPPVEIDSDSEESGGSRGSRGPRSRPRRAAAAPADLRAGRRSSPTAPSRSPPSGDSDSVGNGQEGYADLTCHLRGFLECGGWSTCSIEHYGPSGSSMAAAPRSLYGSERVAFGRPAAWQRLRVACAQQGATARGWVCGHVKRHNSMAALVRLVAIELGPDRAAEDEVQQGSNIAMQLGEGPLPLQPPTEDDGLLGVLSMEDEAPHEAHATQAQDSELLLPPLGTLLRVRFIRSAATERRAVRDAGASCCVSLVADRNSSEDRMPGLLSGGQSGVDISSEWPEVGACAALTRDPSHASIAAASRCAKGFGAVSRAKFHGLRKLHAMLLESRRTVGCPTSARESLGMSLSRTQGKAWADRRVREGVAHARKGDQKGAVERYDAALELCPHHKEGLVGRGAALTNLGRAKEALRNFDLALRLDPEDANALKYREIARKRLLQDGNGSSVPDDSKRRKGLASGAVR